MTLRCHVYRGQRSRTDTARARWGIRSSKMKRTNRGSQPGKVGPGSRSYHHQRDTRRG
ncbi:hypothetical protein FOQG_19181 [Fusarium oxysporum f. sp. raphani 54005]|uniref:Uncharacterized protein n=1 Tax=Fusarium oxysporum f. sp. raphani 54005 TaxID=1089458 RepID=X0BB57_FUSOX|nr:hypothetical protein FOQG_19181 [Fusarium oxysporum f. sp. raphani 54005]